MLDTGATYCVVPESMAKLLGFDKGNRLDVEGTNVVGGQKVEMDRHRLEYVRAGTARAHHIDFLVGSIGPDYKLVMLLGLSFMRRFATTTLDFGRGRVLFRAGT